MTPRAETRIGISPPSRLKRVIAIASGKGGVGKTWFAAALAQALAFAGQRVALIDGDLGLANIDVQLGLDPEVSLGDVLANRKDIGQALCPVQGGAGAKGGFDVVAGRSGGGDLSQMTSTERTRFMEILSALTQSHDWAILDLGAGIDPFVMSMTRAAERTILVVTDEPTALTDAYALIKKLAQAGRTDQIMIVANQVTTHEEGRKTGEALIRAARGFLNIELQLLGAIRRDPRVRDAIRAQTPFLTRSPSSPAAQDIQSAATALIRAQNVKSTQL